MWQNIKPPLFATHMCECVCGGFQMGIRFHRGVCGCHEFDVFVLRDWPLNSTEGHLWHHHWKGSYRGSIRWQTLTSLALLPQRVEGGGADMAVTLTPISHSRKARSLGSLETVVFSTGSEGPWGWQLINVDTLDMVKLEYGNVNEAWATIVCLG